MNKKNIDDLAKVLNERISLIANKPDSIELGTIQPDMSLKLDTFAMPIKKGDYLIADFTAQVEFPNWSLVGVGEYPVDDEGKPIEGVDIYHTAQTRWDWEQSTVEKVNIRIKPELKSGDRVLVVWVNQHRDPVVIAKVVSS